MARKKELSERQQNILKYMHSYQADHSRPPTIREIGANVNISSTSVVNYNLNKLNEKGLLERDAEVSRGLRFTEMALEKLREMGVKVEAAVAATVAKVDDVAADAVETMSRLVRVPLVGDIVASAPIVMGHDDFSAYDDDDMLEISEAMLPKRKDGLFALRVRGDSMIDAMVNDGDIVIMQPQETANNGEMVAVWLDEGTMTLKHFYKEGAQVRLQPANPTMDPIYVNAGSVRVQGKVMMVLRNTA